MLTQLTLAEVSKGLTEKKFSSVEITQAMLDRIDKVNPSLNAYVTVTKELALERAEEADKELAKGAGEQGARALRPAGSVRGVPMGLKDIFNTKGVKTTCCSRIIEEFVPPYDATVVERLNAAGAVMLGKQNMDEFACGSSTEQSCFGPTRNPWDKERVPGGTSGGSAAAVAADLAYYSIGTDTGGSIRQPASFCGVVGLKVTYGRVSRSGVTADASSWDTIGPLCKTVEDAALVLQQIAGRDERDSTTPDVAVPDYSANLGAGVKGLKIGVPREYFGEGIEPETLKLIQAAIEEYKKLGAEVREVSLPYTRYALAAYYITQPAELSANLARFDGIRFGSAPKAEAKDMIDYYYQVRGEGFGDEIKRRIMIGTYVLSAGYYDAYYKKAQKVRTLIIKDFEKAFEEVDVLMAPVSPFPAFKIGEKSDDPLAMYLADVFTIPMSCAGVPALSVPCGFASSGTREGESSDVSSAGLPVGLQIIGPQFSEDKLLQVGAAYEQVTDWRKQRPKL